jgi:TatD DNase family protein
LLIDSHAHLDSERYADDREAMLRRAFDAGVGTVLSIGIGEQAAGMGGALEICRQFNVRSAEGEVVAGTGLPRLYASAGVYPHTTPEIDDAILSQLDGLLAEPEVIACGEIGLDYYHEGAPKDVQRAGLIQAARDCGSAEAADPDPLQRNAGGNGRLGRSFCVLEEHWHGTGLGGVMHCFGGGWEQARRSLEMGFLVSFAGNLTYPKAQPLRDVAAKLPLDGVLVETDAPWLAPAPDRGKRNEPALGSADSGDIGPGCSEFSRLNWPSPPRKTSRDCFG